ncbi:chemotaxis protein CheW [Fundidesulfovibrio putealis]|uniref:chemotaxis protein CheW n=1 Tax=Fundidesulfovibrio putealis TaxID=270496 RepID=UPI00040F9ABB|nr:chemotaxis protein CheW [Fundidesulfovibrio putealis]
MKNLENYFEQDVALPETGASAKDLTGSERAFLEKYVGAGWENTPAGKALERPVRVEQVIGGGLDAVTPDAAPTGQPQDNAAPAVLSGDALEASLMAEEELRLVSFHVSDQVFAVPIMLVQEVLRAVPATKLPAAPPFLAGVTNLRGRVTPLVDLARLLGIPVGQDHEDKFLIVCRVHDMQIGLLVRAIDTMYKAPRGDIEWNIEAQVGVSADLMAGLLKADDRLIKILSVNRLFQKVLKS